MKQFDESIFLQMDLRPILRDGQGGNRPVFRSVWIDHPIFFDPGKPLPPERVDAFQVRRPCIPTVKQHKIRLESPVCCRLQHGAEMVVLGEVIAIFVVHPVVNGERTRPIGPDQGNQADPFDDLVLIAAPLEIG